LRFFDLDAVLKQAYFDRNGLDFINDGETLGCIALDQ